MGVNDDIAHIQNSLNVLYTWSNTWQLNISTSKCATMQIHAVAECSNLRLNSTTITKANEFKDLGVIIDENLKFTSHINHVVAKASVRACLIRKCFVSKDVPTLIRAFKTYIRPILEYASCVWSQS